MPRVITQSPNKFHLLARLPPDLAVLLIEASKNERRSLQDITIISLENYLKHYKKNGQPMSDQQAA